MLYANYHTHTYRCGHAENVPDEEYVKKAIELGASDIWFTDHAPFPGDPFGSRMLYSQLEEYISSISSLKKNYSDINIHLGLETEYFPHFDSNGYYNMLKSYKEIELLILGQHMAEVSDSPLSYSFSESREFLDKNEFKLLGDAIVQGLKTGYYSAVAHPDRIFRRCSKWNKDMEIVSMQIIQSAIDADLPLEMNLSSVEYPGAYRKEFWELVPDSAKRITGFDAHSIDEMESRLIKMKEKKCLYFKSS